MSGKRCYLGLDLGTSSLKVGLFSPEGRRIALASTEIRTYHPRPGWAEQQPDEWWEAACSTTRAVLESSGVEPGSIASIGLTAHTPANVLLDSKDRVLAPALFWADLRAVEQWKRLSTRHNIPHAYSLPARLLWLKENRQDSLQRATKLLMPKDFLGYRLTGMHTTDVTDYVLTRLWNVRSGELNEELLRDIGVEPEMMPPVTKSTEVKGGVTPAASGETGLAPGTPVIAGAVDAESNMVGAGLTEEGLGVLYLGTGAGIRVSLGRGGLVGKSSARTVPMEYVDGLWWFGSMMGIGGGALKWFREAVRGGAADVETYDDYDRMAGDVPAGAEGLFFVPHMQGERSPYYDHRLSGAFVGLRMHHRAAHMVRAMMEGVTFNVLAIGEDINEQTGEPLPTLRAVGGGAQSPVWRSILSSVLATPLDLMEESESTVLGAAILGAAGVGDFTSVVEACESMVHVSGREEPNSWLVEAYKPLYRRFQQAGEAVRKLAVDWAGPLD